MAINEEARRNAQIVQGMSTRYTPTSMATVSQGVLQKIGTQIRQRFPQAAKSLRRVAETPVNIPRPLQTFMRESEYVAQQAAKGGSRLVPFAGNYLYERAVKPSMGGQIKPQTSLGELVGKAAYVTPAAITLRGAPGIGLKYGGISAGISGGITKATGGSFTEGAIEGFVNAPTIAMIGTITNPIIKNAVKITGKNITNPVTKQLVVRSLSSLLNVAEGIPMDAALGKKPLSTQSILIDSIAGFLLTPGANEDLVRAVGDLRKNKLKASKKSILKVQEALQTPENKELIKQANDSLAGPKDRAESIVLFHGSNKKFEQFDLSKAGTGEGSGLFGRGAYLTDSKDVADKYAQLVSKKEYITGYDAGILGSKIPKYVEGADQLAKQKAVINEFIATGKFYNTKNKTLNDSILEKIKEYYKNSISPSQADNVDYYINFARKNKNKIKNFNGELPYLIDQVIGEDEKVLRLINNELEKQGYIGIKYPSNINFEGFDGNNYFIFNPENIKTRTTLPSGDQPPTAEEATGFAPGVKEQFDTALFTKNKEQVSKLLSEVPDEYKERFRPELQSILGEQLPTTEVPRITQLKDKILNNLKKAQEIRTKQEASYTKERGQRKAIAEKLKEQYSGVELQQQKRRAIAGEYGKELYSPEELITKDDLNYLYDEMEKSDKIGFWEKIVASDTLKTLFEDGVSPTNYQLGILRRLYGDDFTKQISEIVKKDPTIWQQIVEFAKIPRALQATADLSAAFRQGVWFITRPEFWKNMPGLVRFAFDPKNFQEQMRQIEDLESYRAQAELQARDRLAITEMEGGLDSAEEAFLASRILNKIPGLGTITRASERSYVGFLNMLRASMFESLYQNAKKTGALEKNPKLLSQIATYVNTSTGRGKVEDLPQLVRGISQLLFSPRLLQSRLELLVPGRFLASDPFIRKQYIRDLSANVALATTILQIAKMNGAEVSDDPTSADFGKIKVGNTRVDIFGGFQQPMVLFARMAYGKKTSSVTGLETKVQRPFIDEGVPTYNKQTLLTLLGDFFNNKSSPETRYFLKALNGFRDAQGNQLDATTETINLFAPLFLQSVVEVMEEDNPYLTAVTAGLGVAGVNVATYGEQVPRLGKTEAGAPRIEYAYEPTFGDIVKEKLAGIPYTTLSQQEQEILISKRDRESADKLAIQEAKKRVKETGKSEIAGGKEIRLVQGEPTEFDLKEISYQPQDPAIAVEYDLLAESFFRNITETDNVPQELINYLDKSPDKAIANRVIYKLYKNDPKVVDYLEKRGLFTEEMANRIVLEKAKENPQEVQSIIYKRLNNLVSRKEEIDSVGADLILQAFQEGIMDNQTTNKAVSDYKNFMTNSAKNKLIGDVAVYKMDQRTAPISERENYLKLYINEIKTKKGEVGSDAFSYLIKLYEQGFLPKASVTKILQGETLNESTLEKYKQFIKRIE